MPRIANERNNLEALEESHHSRKRDNIEVWRTISDLQTMASSLIEERLGLGTMLVMTRTIYETSHRAEAEVHHGKRSTGTTSTTLRGTETLRIRGGDVMTGTKGTEIAIGVEIEIGTEGETIMVEIGGTEPDRYLTAVKSIASYIMIPHSIVPSKTRHFQSF